MEPWVLLVRGGVICGVTRCVSGSIPRGRLNKKEALTIVDRGLCITAVKAIVGVAEVFMSLNL